MTPEQLAVIEHDCNLGVETSAQIDELLAAAREGIEAREDAERWRYARCYLDETDVVAWGDWDGHVPDAGISALADAAIDAARAK